MSKYSVYEQIQRIRHQLWLGHASLMVGSGFSRNADRATPTTPIPPNWLELGDKLIEALHPQLDDNEKAAIRSTKNVPQLADEFDAEFQRPALNALLKTCIQDENLLPSSLYSQVLELPWADIFTTNYDTLLERASKQITGIKYDIVLACKDLPYSESPRIIKLHGSFPSEATHLIISEEDYRTYPEKYSPFVNSVQQAIMESSLCLVGFSGTDPNFLKWIGWVKDNLHNSMPPVYLIGMFDMSVSERILLESKHIVPVDLSALNEVLPGDYSGALDFFFSQLSVQPNYYNWIQPESFKTLSPKNCNSTDDYIAVIKQWENERKTYPNWIVLPWKKRSSLVKHTELWAYDISFLKQLPDLWDIQGLYEFNWRLERCLMPIFNQLIDDYEAILNKYDPFGLENKINTNKSLQEKWLSLVFSLLRWSREELDENRWTKYENIVKEIAKKDIYSQNRLHYEQAFHAMALPNLELLDSIIKEWNSIKHPLLWKVRLSSILYLLNQKDKAHSLWIDALAELRPYVPKSKIKSDFYLLSIEGSILVNLYYTSEWKKDKEIVESGKDFRKKYEGRLKDLKINECNPMEDVDSFALSLERQKYTNEIRESYRDFKAKTTSMTLRFGWDVQYTHAFQFLRFFEEAGIPFLFKDTMHYALSYMADYSPWWAFYMLNIVGSDKNSSCELIFSQFKFAGSNHQPP